MGVCVRQAATLPRPGSVVARYELVRAIAAASEDFHAAVESGQAHGRGSAANKSGKPFVHRATKTGRNDPCPCGSGKKLKKCCG
ncbi:MAG: SEC-C metal-binding domain-containing protein [Planctomycetota bacterium]